MGPVLLAAAGWAACMAMFYLFLLLEEYALAAMAIGVSLLFARFIMSRTECHSTPEIWSKTPDSPRRDPRSPEM
jgi:hypothetical protein